MAIPCRTLGVVATATLLSCCLAPYAFGGTVLHHLGTFQIPVVTAVHGDMIASDDGAFFYVPDAARIHVIAHDPLTHELTWLQTVDANDCYGGRLVLSPDGRFLYAACDSFNHSSQSIVTLARDVSSGLVAQVGSDTVPFYDLHPAMSPDGRYLYAPNMWFSRDVASGALSLLPTFQGVARGYSALEFSASGGWAAVGAIAGSGATAAGKVMYAQHDAASGTFNLRAVVYGAGGILHTPSALAFSADESQLYAVGDGYLSTLHSFDAGLQTSRVFFDGKEGVTGLRYPSSVASSPSAILVSGLRGDGLVDVPTVSLFRRSAGGTTYVQSLGGLESASTIYVTADNARIFVLNFVSATIEILGEVSVCTDAPRADCRASTKSLVIVKDGNTAPTVRFDWQNETTSFPLAGDPIGGSTYSLCMYQDGAGGPSLVLAADAPTGAFWRGRGWKRKASGVEVTDYRYGDHFGMPDGVTKVKLERGRALVRVKKHAGGIASPLTAPLTVQVMTDFGECWTSRFGAADVRVDDPARGRFLARFRAP